MADNVCMRGYNAFTLAELLIALAILGVIATFTIPKVLQSQQNSAWNSKTKEAAAMISGAFEAYKQNNTITGTMHTGHLTPYLNFVRIDSSTTPMDFNPGDGGTFPCNTAGGICLFLHNGGVLMIPTGAPFGNTSATSAIHFGFDPDGKATGNADSISFLLTTRGRIFSWGVADDSIWANGTQANTAATADPPWFSWN